MSTAKAPVPYASAVSDAPPRDVVCRHESHEVFIPPENPDATIWRYLDFTKLVSLVDIQRLFFARVDTFPDAFEGSISAGTQMSRREWYADLNEEDREEMLKSMSRLTESAPGWMYANCWSLSEGESAALWELYVPSMGGVAIRSTYGRLLESIHSEASGSIEDVAPLWIGRVKYIDYGKDLIPDDNTLYPFVHKRKSFKFEKELRAMTWDRSWRRETDPSPIGLQVPVDLNTLIEAIHVSPTAPSWFADLVQSVVKRYGCSAPVVQSSLSAEPLY